MNVSRGGRGWRVGARAGAIPVSCGKREGRGWGKGRTRGGWPLSPLSGSGRGEGMVCVSCMAALTGGEIRTSLNKASRLVS